MALYDYIRRAVRLFDETSVTGTTILAAVDKKERLTVAQIFRTVCDPAHFEDGTTAMEPRTEEQQVKGYVPAEGEQKLRRWPFDTYVWWDSLHDNRIVSALFNESLGYGDPRFAESTGEYVGGFLQGLKEDDHFIIHTVVEGVRTTTHAFRESTEDDEETEETDRIAGYIKLLVTDHDHTIIKMVIDSPAYRVPLVLGQPPKNFVMGKAATAVSA